jgi:hypothetical protein
VSYWLEMQDGLKPAGVAGTISAFTGNVITHSVLSGLAVGQVVTLSGTTSNDGKYTITEIVVGTTQTRVVPTPNAETAAGTIQRWEENTAKLGPVTVTNFLASNVITAAGATFITDKVQKNDRAIITDSGGPQGGGANDGAWYVDSVDSETQLTVRPMNGQANVVVMAGSGASIYVRQGNHRLWIQDESSITLSSMLANTIPLPQQAPASDSFCSGVIGDFLEERALMSKILYLVQGIGSIQMVNTGATNTVWNSLDEIVVNLNKRKTGTQGCNIQWADPNALATQSEFNKGTADGGDRYSADQGSVWIGFGQSKITEPTAFAYTTKITESRYGSYEDTTNEDGTGSDNFAGIIKFYHSIIRPLLTLVSGTGHVLENPIVYPTGLNVEEVPTGIDLKNFALTKSLSNVPIVHIGADIRVPIEGLRLSDLISSGIWNLLNVIWDVLNPKEDYDESLLFGAVTSGEGRKSYTFNPRFVTRNSVGGVPSLIQGLSVQIFSINETTTAEVSLGSWSTDANGRLSGIETDRDGINLQRQINNGVATDYSHRILVRGVDSVTGIAFKARNERFVMRTELDIDFAMDILQPDYEGELGEA